MRRVDFTIDANGIVFAKAGAPPEQDQIALCREWLRLHVSPRKTMNVRRTSYGLKHDVESWTGEYKGARAYVSNGAFISAAIAEGYSIRRCGQRSPDAFFNMSFAPWRALRRGNGRTHVNHRWGPWELDERHMLLCYGSADECWFVPLERCTTSAAVLDVIAQFSGKANKPDEDVGMLVRALDDLLSLQQNLCGGGINGHTGSEMARPLDAVRHGMVELEWEAEWKRRRADESGLINLGEYFSQKIQWLAERARLLQ